MRDAGPYHPDVDHPAEPMLVFRRTGKTIAKVIAGGFGGGTLLLGLTTSLGGTFRWQAIWAAFSGYFVVASPFFLAGAILALCWRELWVVEGEDGSRFLRMITFRPWMISGPRVEQAPLSEYAAVCTAELTHRAEKASFAVALMTAEGEQVPIREFEEIDEARDFVKRLAEATGLVIRRAEPAEAGAE
jgi:hypothetical protein